MSDHFVERIANALERIADAMEGDRKKVLLKVGEEKGQIMRRASKKNLSEKDVREALTGLAQEE